MPRIGIGLAIASVISACISVGTIAGYRPSGPGAPYDGPLPPIAGRETWMVPLADGACVLVAASPGSVYPTPFEQILLDVCLLISEGVTVQLLAPELVFVARDSAESSTLPVVCVEDWTNADPRARVRAPDAVLLGSSRTNVHPGFGLSLVREGPRTQTGVPVVAEFELRLPAFLVDGQVIMPAPIRFEACEHSGAWMSVD